jgi:hypothetical protein
MKGPEMANESRMEIFIDLDVALPCREQELRPKCFWIMTDMQDAGHGFSNVSDYRPAWRDYGPLSSDSSSWQSNEDLGWSDARWN